MAAYRGRGRSPSGAGRSVEAAGQANQTDKKQNKIRPIPISCFSTAAYRSRVAANSSETFSIQQGQGRAGAASHAEQKIEGTSYQRNLCGRAPRCYRRDRCPAPALVPATRKQMLCRFAAVRLELYDAGGGGPKGCLQLLRDRGGLWAAGRFTIASRPLAVGAHGLLSGPEALGRGAGHAIVHCGPVSGIPKWNCRRESRHISVTGFFAPGNKIDLITRQPAARRIYRGDRCVVGSQQYTDRPCRPLGKR